MSNGVSPGFVNPLPGIPHIESPFFNELFPPERNDDAAKFARVLHRDGVVRIRFRTEDFDRVADEAIGDLQGCFDRAQWQAGGSGVRIQDAWRGSDAVRRIATNTTVLRLLEQLYGRRAFPFQTWNFPVGAAQEARSDAIHFSSVPERFMCSGWVALEDVTLDNGPLLYYPGSHRWPIFTSDQLMQSLPTDKPLQERYIALWQALAQAKGVAPQRFTARKGEGLIWMANMLYGGLVQNDRNRTRWSQLTHYYFDDCAYYSSLTSDPIMGAIDFYDPVDISTGTVVRSSFGGAPLPEGYVQACRQQVSHDRLPFDPALYLLANPDVAAAKMDPWQHYLVHGKHEGRRLRP